MENFDFIADIKFKSLLERDFEELQECINHKLSKSAVIMSGSIIEAMLLEFFIHNLPKDITLAKLYRFELNDLINEAESVQLISKRSKDLSVVIKDYRNLIHPGREIRTNENVDYETAIVSFSLVKIVLKEIRENYLKQYGYKAEDIYNKIIVDSSTFSIFPNLLQKLNHYEKIRLSNMFVDRFIDDYNDNLFYRYNRYIDVLKSNLESSDIGEFCKRLLKEVEKGKEEHIIVLFDLFGNNLDTLTKDEQELVLVYIYNTMNQITIWNVKIDQTKYQKAFLHLGIYLNPDAIKDKFFELLIKIVRHSDYVEGDKKNSYLNVYNNLLSNFEKDKIEKCEAYVRASVPEKISEVFYSELEKYNEFPF